MSEDEAPFLEIGYKPPNTSKNTKWALKNFEEWRMARNSSVPNDDVPPSLLTGQNPIQLNKWLSRFVIETRKNKGKQYPPSTIHQLLTGILRHMGESNPHAPNFLDKKNPTFRGLHGTLDNLFRSLHEKGIRRKIKHSEVITKEEENRLWEHDQLGKMNPKTLQRTSAFLLQWENFSLQCGEEHRFLKIFPTNKGAQPRWVHLPGIHLEKSYGYIQANAHSWKKVSIYATPEFGDRCHVHLLDYYLEKLSAEARDKDFFYVRHLEKYTADSPWYSAVPVGKYTLSKIVEEMCDNAGISGSKTNHSHNADVPEKLIQQGTGH